jgi:transposase-like protein
MAHPEQLKAAAMAALLAGESAHKVAERFNISRTTVRRWRDAAWSTVQNGPQKRELGDQLLGYVGESIETQRAQLHVMADPEWILRQSARDVAQLFGVVFDQTERMLVALQQGEARDA